MNLFFFCCVRSSVYTLEIFSTSTFLASFFYTCYRTQNLLKHITLNLFPLSSSHCNKCNSLHFLHHVFPLYITCNEYHHNKIHSLWHSWLIPAFHEEERLLQPLWIYTDLAFSIRRHAVMWAASREGKPFPACWWNKDRNPEHEVKFAPSHTAGQVAIGIFSRLTYFKYHDLYKEGKEEQCCVSDGIFEDLHISLNSPQNIIMINRPLACWGFSGLFFL